MKIRILTNICSQFLENKQIPNCERTEEAHYQRAYDMDTLKRLIEKNGLALVSFLDEDMKQMPNETSERIYVIVQA